MMTTEIRHLPSLDDANRQIAALVVEKATTAVAESGIFTLVLSGGSTPRRLYEYLAAPPCGHRLPWSHTHIFWGDERCVPLADPASNFAMAKQTLLAKVDLPAANIHRMPAELQPPLAGATAYEKELAKFFQARRPAGLGAAELPEFTPSFDLLLLGMGADGHTASLFPGAELLESGQGWVAATAAPQGFPAVHRLTLTLRVINAARWVIFLVSGREKAQLFELFRQDPDTAKRLYPAALVKPAGRLLWIFADS